MESTEIIWPPRYKIKTHRLAKYVKLRAFHANELQITIPHRYNLKKIPALLEENKDWIIKKLSELQLQTHQKQELPHSIMLHAFSENWSIKYIESKVKLQIFLRPYNEIVLIGNTQNVNLCIKKIMAWIKSHFKIQLLTELRKTSDEIKLPFIKGIVRNQKTLWGSCNANKVISLNYKLIFLPKEVMRYILIHELCHTKFLNHSKRFWNLVGQFDPMWREHKKMLKESDQFIPRWFNCNE